ncbi:16S rRNA (cytosine(1402)-N(4))-methyltransferase RsmH [Helicobacter sp. MIT 05-5294]|uniref:16S rRNA (cytosine(1402)-N(4))-methyltransferase RsmH n=1 Tax=Helicobacter sp. MIT 05-5294 TaxID=1548150 RepID=UPI00051F8AE1|nr:16S rRNA (cytosine(1402)-N(4))-methyltransferase RsmH [Helicobacter sp. MIT 05-5294]TLD85890.1 16S rRNA (cytosine(1402)-N(4))-methyltransferase RsmH [Helicobacter sp. MIT 05-5294]
MKIPHIPVLLEQVLESFNTDLAQRGGVLVDCTLGFGGHSEALLKAYPKLKIIGIDQDKNAIHFSLSRLKDFGERFESRFGRYSEVLGQLLRQDEMRQNLVGILADIGVSSLQFDDRERGFCFDSEQLDMRMNQERILDAKEIVNHYSLSQLEQIFRDFGEIREYKKLARLIVDSRKVQKFTSSKMLSDLIAKHFKHPKIHPATLAFQALRIAVNDELGELERLLYEIRENPLPDGARLSIISFHSLEDRLVKLAFKEWEKKCICDDGTMLCTCGNNHQKGKNLYKKPLCATESEVRTNPRSRSAKLRCFEFNRENK